MSALPDTDPLLCDRTPGADLKPGDTIKVWWQPGRDQIVTLKPYTGPLAHLFKDGASIASFALNKCGMTIDHGERFVVIEAPK